MSGVDRGAADVALARDTGSASAFEQAIAHGIAESLSRMEELQCSVDKAFAVVDAAMDRSGEEFGADEGENIAASVEHHNGEIQAVRNEAAELFERQRKVLSSVNIALFGRTGAGKSSLIEALTHGDGSSISTGESDFTTVVREACWRGCKVIDTPGTQGWGRSESRDVLERRAGHAVEVADIVLLCFDTQSQQEGEFQKVSEWVREHGKPVIAVLNVRNAMWRRPDKIRLGSARRRLSNDVGQHASHIAGELGRLGLFDVPIVAIHAQRAAYARVDGEYRGPAPQPFFKLRCELGADALLQGSSLGVLEAVIAEALTSHATELRLGMLHSQVHTLFNRLIATVARGVDEAERGAASGDQTLEKLFGLLGYPAVDSATRIALPQNGCGVDLLSQIESHRGEPYQAPACGKLERFAQQRLNSLLGRLRSESLRRANVIVEEAFDAGRHVEPDAFVQTVFDSAKVNATCDEVFAGVVTQLQDEADLVIEEAKLDLQFNLAEQVAIKGEAGRTKRWVGYGAGTAGVVSGIASTLFGAAILDPEPVSKILLGMAAAVTGLISWGLNSLSKKLRKDAEEARQTARSEANAITRRAVNEFYDRVDEQLAGVLATMMHEAALQMLRQPLQEVYVLRALITEGQAAATNLLGLSEGLPERGDAQRVLSAASHRVAALRTASAEISIRGVLLGEGWITDPVGLDTNVDGGEPVRTKAYDLSRVSGLLDRFKDFFSQLGLAVLPGDGARWLDAAERDCAMDEAAMAELGELRALQQGSRPRLFLFGDYSSGKTSFVKRLLIDAGLPLPESLEVRASPTTDAMHIYEWEGFDLVDTPGLKSNVKSHTEVTMAAYPEASVVINLLPPNLLIGSSDALEQLLKGDRSRGLAAKLDRTIFVIHRSDELGTSPDDSPEEYLQLCARKKLELCNALASKGVAIDANRLFCMAADPYQLVGDRLDVSSAQFDPYRAWDGFTEFHKAVREIARQFRGMGVDRAVLDGGLARFGRLGAADGARRASAEGRQENFVCFRRNLHAVIAEGRRLEDQYRARIGNLIEDHMYAHVHRVSESSTEAQLAAATEQLKRWWESDDLRVDVDGWQRDAVKSIDHWWSQGCERLDRVMASARFRHAVTASKVQFKSVKTASGEYGWVGNALNAASKPLKGATPKVVYKLGKFLNVKFKPYGAINAAKGFAKAGVVLSAVAAGVDAVILVVDWKNEGKRATNRKKLQDVVRQSADQIIESLTEVGDGAAGPIAYLRERIDLFETIVEENGSVLAAIASEIAGIDERRNIYRACMERAWASIEISGERVRT